MSDIVEQLRDPWKRGELENRQDVMNRAADEIERLREALQECTEVLELNEHPRREDPDYGHEVAALGDRIGYGALMSSASATWRRRLKEDGHPVGGEHVAGPCQATITRALQIARAAITSDVREGK